MSLRMSENARSHLMRLTWEAQLKQPVVTIVRGHSVDGEDMGWSVGLIERAKLVNQPVAISGQLSVYIDEQWIQEVSKCILEVQRGRFILVPDDRDD